MGSPSVASVAEHEVVGFRNAIISAAAGFEGGDLKRQKELLNAIRWYFHGSGLLRQLDKPVVDYDWDVPNWVSCGNDIRQMAAVRLGNYFQQGVRLLRISWPFFWMDDALYALTLSRNEPEEWVLLCWEKSQFQSRTISTDRLVWKFFNADGSPTKKILFGAVEMLRNLAETKLKAALAVQKEATFLEVVDRVAMGR